jgi:hypothetical protein
MNPTPFHDTPSTTPQQADLFGGWPAHAGGIPTPQPAPGTPQPVPQPPPTMPEPMPPEIEEPDAPGEHEPMGEPYVPPKEIVALH